MRKYFLLLVLLLSFSFAVLEHSPETQREYLKYRSLTKKYPNSKSYLFEYAMVMAYMGKIEEAGQQLKKINEMDDNYARKLIAVLEAQKNRDLLNWKLRFKLGFVYYFLFEEANGRIELAQRRIKKAKEYPERFDADTIPRERDIIAEKTPIANDYRGKAIFNFRKVAEKKPRNAINAWGYAYMAVIRALDKDWVDAKALCEQALDIAPDAYAIRAAYMEALKQTGDFFGSTAQLTIAMRLKNEQEAYEQKLFNNK